MLDFTLVPQLDITKTNFMDLLVVFTPDSGPSDDYPPVRFNIQTYEKISKTNQKAGGESIMEPANVFVSQLSTDEQLHLYNYYKDMYDSIAKLSSEIITNNIRCSERSDKWHLLTRRVMTRLDIPTKLLRCAESDYFLYPDLTDAGSAPHHSKDMTFG